MEQREKVIPLAGGKVLEVGIGSGLSLSLYDAARVESLTAIDPSGELWKKHKTEVDGLGFDFEFIETTADQIPEDDNVFDSVVCSYTLCSIVKLEESLNEIRRVLKPGGELFFCEHGKSPDRSLQKWQNRVNPLWKRVGGGCNLNRDIPKLLEENGFQIKSMNSQYLTGWKLSSYNYWGSASVKST